MPPFQTASVRNGTLAVSLICGLAVGCTANNDTSALNRRLAKAQAMFSEHCRVAGEKIFRTVNDVHGVVLLRGRPKDVNYGDQFRLDDPYGSDFGGDAYISSFLLPTKVVSKSNHENSIGYRFVDVTDPKDGMTYRYTGSWENVEITAAIGMGGTGKPFVTKEFVLHRVLVSGSLARFGVTYEDISSPEDREYWIAGSSLKVVDLKTNEVVAERIGYMIDLGQGSTGQARSPWLLAADHACPSFWNGPHAAHFQPGQSARFVKKILEPVSE